MHPGKEKSLMMKGRVAEDKWSCPERLRAEAEAEEGFLAF
jgi:hypothetical protein